MKFRNISGDGLDVGRPAGKLGSLWVGPGEDIEVPGTLAEAQPPDGYAVERDGEARVWPKELWELVGRDARAWKKLRDQATTTDTDIGDDAVDEGQGDDSGAATVPVDERGEG